MTVYELRKILANITNQNKEIVIKESNVINFGDNAPIDAICEKNGVIYIVPLESIGKKASAA